MSIENEESANAMATAVLHADTPPSVFDKDEFAKRLDFAIESTKTSIQPPSFQDFLDDVHEAMMAKLRVRRSRETTSV
jgi:hypothetical protein